MDKIAQRRSMFQWLHEKVNVPRKFTERYSDEYKDQMELLREADSNARKQAQALEYWLKSERRSLNKHHYIDVVYFAGQIASVVNEIIHGYDGLRELKKKHEYEIVRQREHAPEEFLGASAGIISRYFEGRARRLLLGEQKKEMTKLYNESKRLIVSVLNGLKEMGSLRASGEVVGYLKEVDKLEKHLNDFNKLYSEVYDKHIKNLVPARSPEVSPEISVTDEAAPPSEPFPLTTQKSVQESPELKVEVDAGPGIAPAIPSQPEESSTPTPPEPSLPEAPKTEEPSKAEEVPVPKTEEPKLKRKPRAKKPPKAASDKIIIEIIKSGMDAGMSDKDIYSMLIEKSAEYDEDSEFSMKLLAVAEGFINE